MIRRCFAVALATLLAFPMAAFAQGSPAGVVTTLEGNVTAQGAARTSATPVPLRFKDSVFHQDRITTGDKSLARMLLGGKAVVTVRERSVLTITESPNRSVVELTDGKFALAVARERMRPGETIEVRTPNAVAGVRGTVVITEVLRSTAQAGGPPPGVVTNFYVLRGTIEASALGQPGGPANVGQLQRASFAGGAPMTIAPIPPEQVGQITSGLRPAGKAVEATGAGQEQIKTQAMQTATGLVTLISGAPVQTFPAATTPIVQPTVQVVTPVTNSENQLDPCPGCVRIAGQSLFVSGQPFHSLSGTLGSGVTNGLLGFESSEVFHDGSPSFIEVASGSNIGLSGPLATVINTEIETTGTFIDIHGNLTSLGSGPLVTVDPSFVVAGDALFALTGATVTLAGPLLTDVLGTFIIDAEFLRMHNSSLTSTSPDPLVTLNSSTVSSATALTMVNSHMQLAGPLVRLVSLGISDEDAGFSAPFVGIHNGSTLNSTTTQPLIQIASTGLEHTDSLFVLTNGASVNLNGSLFGVTDSFLGPAFRVVELIGGASPVSLIVAGSVINAVDAHISAPSGLIGVFDGSSLTTTTPWPLVSLTGTAVDNGGVPFAGQGAILGASGTTSGGAVNTINLQAPVLVATDSSITLGAGIIDLFDGTALASTTLDPLVSLNGGVHSFGGPRALVHLVGRSSTVTEEFNYEVDTGEGPEPFTIFLGTDRMISTGGILLDFNGATVTSTNGGVAIDSALVEASAPLINLRNNASVTLGGPAVELVQQARLNAAGPVVQLDNSVLNIINNHGITVGGGAFPSVMNVTGALMALNNSSTVNINNGAILSVFNAVVRITGPLVAFGAGSNVINLTNTFCSSLSCFTQNGITVALSGVSSSQVQIGAGAITGTGTINKGASAAHVLVGGSQSKVTIAVP